MGRWKAVRQSPTAAWEVFDLSTDPGETHEVAREQAEFVTRVEAIAAGAHSD
jgi:hypothetical protein